MSTLGSAKKKKKHTTSSSATAPAVVEQGHRGEQPPQTLLVHLDLQVRHEVVKTVDVERRRVRGFHGAQGGAPATAALGRGGGGGGGRVGGDDGVVAGEMVAQSAQIRLPFCVR